MPRIDPLDRDQAPAASLPEWDRQVQAHGRMTNMKRTLARNSVALEAYMRWYPLRDEVQAFLGRDLTVFFAHAISSEADCLVCTTYFRKSMVDAGLDPDDLVLDEKAMTLLEFGRQIARDPHGVEDALYHRVAATLDPDQILTLTAFAGLMVATNLVNDVLGVGLDEYLAGYRPEEDA